MNTEYIERIVNRLEELRIDYIEKHGVANCDIFSKVFDKDSGIPGCHAAWLALADPTLLGDANYSFILVAENFIKKAELSCEDVTKYWNYLPYMELSLPPSSPFLGKEIIANIFGNPYFFGGNSRIFDVSIIINKWREFLEGTK